MTLPNSKRCFKCCLVQTIKQGVITPGADTDLCLCWPAFSLQDSCAFFVCLSVCLFVCKNISFSFLRPSLFSTGLWSLEEPSGWSCAFFSFFCSPIKFCSGLVIFKIFYNPSVSHPSFIFYRTMLTACQINLAQISARLGFVATSKCLKGWAPGPLYAWAFAFSLNWARYENTNKSCVTHCPSQEATPLSQIVLTTFLLWKGSCTKRFFCFQPNRRNFVLESCPSSWLEVTLATQREQEFSCRQQDKVMLTATYTQAGWPGLRSRNTEDIVFFESMRGVISFRFHRAPLGLFTSYMIAILDFLQPYPKR